ncbi:MAG: insulinase family protein [Cyanobacteria bacterium SZAS TMP-1]|nr:insulinase family protein [Cyanobacteria bacterium SZAS TMP-1]
MTRRLEIRSRIVATLLAAANVFSLTLWSQPGLTQTAQPGLAQPVSPSPAAPATPAQPASAQPAAEAPQLVPVKANSEAGVIQELKLPNGLKVIMLEDHSFPVFSCMVFYRVGSRNENLGETGVSHLVEHLLFEKVGKFRKGEIGATIARNGGMFNGFTSDDFTVFFETLNASKLDLALRVESERMKGGAFSAEEVQAEVKRIEKELDQEAKDSANTLTKEVKSNAFQLHPYKNPTIGWRSDVQKLTLDDARKHYKEYYQPGNATLVLVGDFNSANALTGIKKYFAGIAAGAPPRAVRVSEPEQRAERRVVMKYAGASDVVSIAYHAPAFLDDDTAAMAVLEKLLLSGNGGRLKSKLVDGKICSNVRCSFEVKHDPGLFSLTLTGAPGVPAQKITESFESVIDQLKNSPVSDTELRRARNHAEFNFLSERDGPYRTAFQIGYFDILDKWQSAFSSVARLRSVSAADVQRVAKRYFGTETRVVGVLAGQATKAAADALAKKNAEKAAREKESDKDKDKEKGKEQSKSKDKGKDKEKDKGKKSKDKEKEKEKDGKGHSRHHHRHTASVGKAFGIPIYGYKDDDAAVVTRPAASKPAAEKAPATTYQSKVKQATLKNGLVIGVLETKLSPMVQIVGAVKAGEAYEPVGKRGAATVLAEVMNQGSTKYTRAQAVSLQDDLGLPPQSMVRFESGPQWINFQGRCFSRDTASVLGVLTAALKAPSMKDEDVEHAKQICEDRIKRSTDTVKAKLNRALLRGLIAPNTSFYPLDPSDKAKFLSNLKPSDVREFQAQAVKPDGATIVFVGDISLSQAVDLCDRACEGWTGKSTAKKALVQPNPRRLLKSSLIVDRREDTMVTLGRLVDAGLGSADYPLLLVADCALTNHPIISRFAQKISGELSLSSSLSLEDLASDVESLPGTTVWSVDIPVVSNLMPVAVKSIQSELKRFAKSGLTAEEYNEVRMYLRGALPVRWMSTSPLAARSSLEALMLDHQADPLPELLTGIGLANVDTVNRFIRMTFKPDRSSVVIAGTKQSIGQVHGLRQDEQSEGPYGSGAGGSSGGSSSSANGAGSSASGTGGASAGVKKAPAPAH